MTATGDLWRLLKPLAAFGLAAFAVLGLSRVGLVAWQWDRVAPTGGLTTLLAQGLRFDAVTLGFALALPAVLTPLLCAGGRTRRIWGRALPVYLTAVLSLLLLMELATPPFVGQYDSRPNATFFEYLVYPRELFSTLWAAYKLPMLLVAALVPAFAFFAHRTLSRQARDLPAVSWRRAIVLPPILLALCVGAARSTFDHRPVNPSTVAFSTDPLVNDLALNSTYTLLYAAYERRHESTFRYGRMARQEIVDLVRAEMRIDAADFTRDDLPTMHRQRAGTARARPLNLVIVLEESLGAGYVGALGGIGVTPCLDRLAAQGMWFENLYATGTRSVRGLEALVTGFPPTPSASVLKLGKSQRDFFSIARLLGARGYDTSFIYGGESQFDNMRRFFTNNGFESVVDKNDFANPAFAGSWGVSDEDLFDRAHEEFLRKAGRPFFSLVFTTSNHPPFEFPDGRIALHDADKHTANNAAKYADYALGRFFEKARASAYWGDTLFLVVADHDARVHGAALVPVERFRIPALILGADVAPSVFRPVASQLDLPPTLLSLMGVSSEHPMIGRDLTRPDLAAAEGRAIMQYNNSQAYLEGDRVVIFQKDLPPTQFDYRAGALFPAATADPALTRKALAHALWGPIAYDEKLHRMP